MPRDDIPLLSQWIKKRQVETCRFLEVQSRTGRIVVVYRLGTLGSVNSLLYGVKRCENDT